MALSKDDLQAISMLFNEGIAPITKEIQSMKSEMAAMRSEMVTKTGLTAELKTLRSEMVTKTGLAAELKTLRSEMVTKTGLAAELKTLRSEMVTKTELAAELETLRSEMCTKEDFKFLFDELMKVETWTGKIERRVDDLTGKVDTLLLQSDNSMMILELYKQHSGEINNLKYRVDKIERKMA